MGSDMEEESLSDNEQDSGHESEPVVESNGSDNDDGEASEHDDQPDPMPRSYEQSKPPAREPVRASREPSRYKEPMATTSSPSQAESASNDYFRKIGRADPGVEMAAMCKMTDWRKSEKDTKLLRELSGKRGIDKLKHMHREPTGFVRRIDKPTPTLTYAAIHALPFSLMELLLVRHAGWDEANTAGPATLELLVGHARRAPGEDRDQWIGILATLFWIHIAWVKDIDTTKRAKYPPLFEFLERNNFQGSQLIEWEEAVALAKDLILGVGLKKAPERSRMKRVTTGFGRR